MIGHVVRFYTSVFSSPVGLCVGVSTLSSSTLFVFFFFRMTLIAAASSDVLISFIAVRRPEGGSKSSVEPEYLETLEPLQIGGTVRLAITIFR
jgi:hypothetical protein